MSDDPFIATAETLKVMTPEQRKIRLEVMDEKERQAVKEAFHRLYGEVL
jgi:hypothetical protein